MRRLAGAYPSLPEGHMVVAQAAQAAGEKAAAVEEARTAVRLQPDSESATIMLAQFQQFDAPAEADAALSAFIARNPKSVPMRLSYARFLNGEKRYDDAAAQLARVRKDAGNVPETMYTLGLLAYQANKPKDSEAYFKRFVELRTPSRKAGKATPVPAAAADDNDDNHRHGVRRVDRSGSRPRPRLPLPRADRRGREGLSEGARLARQGRLGQRLRDRAHQARADPRASGQARRRPQPNCARCPTGTPAQATQLTLAEAQILRDADQNQAAFDFLGGAIEKTPNNPDLLYDYGMTAEKLGRFEILENSMRSVIRVRPDNAQAYNALGYTLADRNERLDEAKALIEKANALSPDDASILDSLGWVQYRLGNNGDALQSLERAYKLRNDAEIGVHLGEVLWVSGRAGRCREGVA